MYRLSPSAQNTQDGWRDRKWNSGGHGRAVESLRLAGTGFLLVVTKMLRRGMAGMAAQHTHASGTQVCFQTTPGQRATRTVCFPGAYETHVDATL